MDSFCGPEYKNIVIELEIHNFGTGGAWNDHDTVCPIAFQNQKQWWVYKDTSKNNLNPNTYHDFGVRCVDNDDNINQNEFAMASYVFESTMEEQKFEILSNKSVGFIGFYWNIMNKHGKDTIKNFQRMP